MPRNLNDFDDYLNKKKKPSVDFELNLKTFGTSEKKSKNNFTKEKVDKKNKKTQKEEKFEGVETIDVEERDKKGSILKKIQLIFKNNTVTQKNNKKIEKTNKEIEEIKLYDNYEKVFEDTKILLKKVFSKIDKKELEKLRKTKEFNELAEIFFDQW